MTVRKKRDSISSWSYKDALYSLNPSYGHFFDRKTRRFHSGTTARVDSRETSSSEFSNDLIQDDRSSRLAALFAALFIVTLLIAITFITLIAFLSDGFTTLAGNATCSSANSSLNTVSHSLSLPEYGKYCLSENCIRLAANYLNNMNREISPCDDFYEFACGRYSYQKVVADHEKKVNVLSDMKKDLDRHIKDILEKSSRETSSRPLKLTQIYYDSCLDHTSQNDQGTLPLTSLISQLGGWPLLTNARFDSSNFQWESLDSHLNLLGVDGLIKISVHNSPQQSREHILTLSPPRLFLEKKKFYRDPPASNVQLGFYKQYIMGLLELLGVDMEDESGVIEYQVNDVIDVERRISNMTSDSSRGDSGSQMNMGELKRRFPQINWAVLLGGEVSTLIGPITDQTVLFVTDIIYFNQLAALIKAKPMSSINNYMMWRLVSSVNAYLPPRFRIPYQQFRTSMVGTTEEVPLWEECVNEVKSKLAVPLATAYAEKYFSHEDKEKADEMISDLRQSMEQTLLNADWMDEQTRQLALVKLDKMTFKIGYPQELKNETVVLTPFAGVRLTANQYFDNAVTLKKASVRHNIGRLHRPQNAAEWHSPVVAVDAFHYFPENEIIFPAAVLQFPMFSADAPPFANYGAVGMGVGHEMTHGFDDLGNRYDADGNLRSWWLEESISTYSQKKKCLVQQYAMQIEPITERKIDGRSTVGENIADNGGLRVAYQAFILRTARDSTTQRLPGLDDYSQLQLFFMSFANTWCEALKPSAVDYLLDTDVHAPGRFRVNVPLQNFPQFAKAFDCPIGSPMNPYEKCRIW